MTEAVFRALRFMEPTLSIVASGTVGRRVRVRARSLEVVDEKLQLTLEFDGVPFVHTYHDSLEIDGFDHPAEEWDYLEPGVIALIRRFWDHHLDGAEA